MSVVIGVPAAGAARTVAVMLLALLWMQVETASAQDARVYRDRVEPHWFADGTRFWYRLELADRKSEFVVVNAVNGTRQPAFDHALAATLISAKTGREHTKDQLPVQSIEFPQNSDDATDSPSDPAVQARPTVILSGQAGRFRFDQSKGELTVLDMPDTAGEQSLFMPPRPSGSSTRDTQIVLTNRLDHPIELFWISPESEERTYGRIANGETREQHTFVGHVWMVRRNDGSPIGCFEASESGAPIVISASTKTERDSRSTRPGRRRRPQDAPQLSRSPDGLTDVFVREHNLWLKPAAPEAPEAPLTTDATADHTFRCDAQRARLMNLDYERPEAPEADPDVRWSPDSKFLLAFQTTQVAEPKVWYVESTPTDQLQPKLHSYPYLKAGDPIPTATPRLFHAADKREIAVSNELFETPWSLDFVRWDNDGSRFWLRYNARGHQVARLLEVTCATGAVRAIIDESSRTFIHYSADGKSELRWLKDNSVLWASERSGWNHLYRYDLATASVTNAVTSGEWNLRRIEHLDEESGHIWFYAVGIRKDQDPCHEHFCRARLDGTELVVLTDGDGMHAIEWSPDRKWLIDRYSRVDLPPVTELRNAADGSLVVRLEVADASELVAQRGGLPRRFTAMGRDGATDIWGILHLPKDYKPDHKYPVIEQIYAGPHDYHVPKTFRPSYQASSFCDLGFIVVQIDGMGTAWRSKAFHDVCFQNLKDAGFPDRIAWMKAAAIEFPGMDLDRVGIFGGSAGGQNAMAALLWHNDFYKAAVADCGCHDNRMDKIWWNEQWMGYPVGPEYSASSNMENAHLLQGHLMLVVGEMDRNVDPATTTQVVRKLIAAGKDFDFVLIPGAGHGACETPWGRQRRADFFVRHLKP